MIVLRRGSNVLIFKVMWIIDFLKSIIVIFPLQSRSKSKISEFAICHVVRHGNVNSFQNPSTVTNTTMEPYCIRIAVLCNVTNSQSFHNERLTAGKIEKEYFSHFPRCEISVEINVLQVALNIAKVKSLMILFMSVNEVSNLFISALLPVDLHRWWISAQL